MSFAKIDRKDQLKIRKDFQPREHDDIQRIGSARFAEEISLALRSEFGGSGSAIKTIARLIDANERAVKNWFDGSNGPSGEFLVQLCRHSDQVLETMLILSGRTELVQTRNFLCAKEKLLQMLNIINSMENQGEEL